MLERIQSYQWHHLSIYLDIWTTSLISSVKLFIIDILTSRLIFSFSITQVWFVGSVRSSRSHNLCPFGKKFFQAPNFHLSDSDLQALSSLSPILALVQHSSLIFNQTVRAQDTQSCFSFSRWGVLWVAWSTWTAAWWLCWWSSSPWSSSSSTASSWSSMSGAMSSMQTTQWVVRVFV